MLDKLKAVQNRYEELCARSEQADFYADPQKAAKLLREKNILDMRLVFVNYRHVPDNSAKILPSLAWSKRTIYILYFHS